MFLMNLFQFEMASLENLLGYVLAILPILLSIQSSSSSIKEDLRNTLTQARLEIEKEISYIKHDLNTFINESFNREAIANEKISQLKDKLEDTLIRLNDVEEYLRKENYSASPFRRRKN